MNLIYLLTVKPFEEKRTLKIEIANEGFILALSYLLVIFTDYVPQVKIRIEAGYATIALLIFNFIFNIMMMTPILVKKIKCIWLKIKTVVSRIQFKKETLKKYNNSNMQGNIDVDENCVVELDDSKHEVINYDLSGRLIIEHRNI